MAGQPLRTEFDVLWRTGLCGEDEEISETAAVCYIGLDSGDTTLTRTFYKTEDDDHRAEDHLLEWLTENPALQEADDIHIKIFLNYSPQGATSEGLVSFIQSLTEQEKRVAMRLRFVKLFRCKGEDEAEENKHGLRLLRRSKVVVDVVRECDWLFLMNVLTNREAKREQGKAGDKVKRELEQLFKDPRDKETCTNQIEVADSETNTELTETVDAEMMTDDWEPEVIIKEIEVSSSSSDDEEAEG